MDFAKKREDGKDDIVAVVDGIEYKDLNEALRDLGYVKAAKKPPILAPLQGWENNSNSAPTYTMSGSACTFPPLPSITWGTSIPIESYNSLKKEKE